MTAITRVRRMTVEEDDAAATAECRGATHGDLSLP